MDTLAELQDTVWRRDESFRFVDFPDIDDVGFELGESGLPEHLVVAGEEPFRASLRGVGADLCGMIGVPASFLRRAPDDLAHEVVSVMFREAQAKTPFGMWVDGGSNGEVATGVRLQRAENPHRCPLAPVVDAAVTSLRGLADSAEQEWDLRLSLTYGEGLRTTLLSGEHRSEHPRALGDITRTGVRFDFDDFTGRGQVQGFLLRLVCLNGMTNESPAFGACRWSTFEPEKAAVEVVNGVLGVYGRMDAGVQAFYSLLDHTVTRPDLALSALRNSGVPQKVVDAVAARWAEDHPGEAFGLVNALTFVSTHRADFADGTRQFLASRASAHTFTVAQSCPACAQRI